ncbi:immunity 42 family protein [Yersinia aldovae]|uniref:immunity 42 family protein n=1 Tax=Yersinia aldovae TaxID=29483 RepID=UPI00119CC0C8|nr:immunity 42 family protein [Yersinia aldovae]
MIFGDPNKFAILMDYVPLWSSEGGYKNGLFHFIVDGEFFPNYASVATLSGDISCLSDDNALITVPENEYLFKADKLDSFSKIMNAMLPNLLNPDAEVSDDFEEDYRYQASTYNLENDTCYVFSVGFMGKVRILAAKVSYLDGNDTEGYEWRNYNKLEVHEVILSKDEVHHIVSEVKEKYELI